ncbi:MAG: ribonuclease III [Verrucomicrobia bacterium]|nr:MAG: ribonuclease III [Verrucomicrobiota bacterium]
METLEQRLDYQFRNHGLLRQALTHPSLGHEKQRYHDDNQRLEFLGDAVLQLVITEYLYAHFPREQEGRLTKLRARLVSRDALTAHAQSLDLGRHLLMGRGEEASGGRSRASTLADAFEAIVGAIYLDSAFVTAREFVLKEMRGALENVREAPVDINPKGQLQEILQSLAMRGPTYEVLSATGPEHAKTFVVEARWEGVVLGRGIGLSKQAAEIEAANNALENKIWEKK